MNDLIFNKTVVNSMVLILNDGR